MIPKTAPENLTLVITMVDDVTYLEEVQIMDFPTEEIFKEAVLALNIPLEREVDNKNLSKELMLLMAQSMPMDGALNYRYYMDQYASSISGQYQPRTSGFLNPFNWARFFRDLKQNRE